MDLRGARLVFCSETDEGRRFNAAKMRKLCGGDPIRGRRMRQDTVQFDPSHTLVMLTNRLPKVSADDPAVWRRLIISEYCIPVTARAVASASASWLRRSRHNGTRVTPVGSRGIGENTGSC
jgi:hypothetical protein